MNSIDMESLLQKPVWHDRFGARLMQLQPRMNAVTAAEHAAATYPNAADLEPEEAAERFAAAASHQRSRNFAMRPKP